MTLKEQILDLFEQLPDTERPSLLQELYSRGISETILIEDAPMLSCPHCDSKLFVKNGKRGSLQKYRCKSCCKIFSSRTGTPLHKINKLDKFEAYKALGIRLLQKTRRTKRCRKEIMIFRQSY